MNAGLSLQASYSLRPRPEAQTRLPLGANDMPYDLHASGAALSQIQATLLPSVPFTFPAVKPELVKGPRRRLERKPIVTYIEFERVLNAPGFPDAPRWAKSPTIFDLLFDNSLKLKNGSSPATRSERMIFTLDVRSSPFFPFVLFAYSKVIYEVVRNVISD